jgi:hypothetical protein
MCEALGEADFVHSVEVVFVSGGESPIANGFDFAHPADLSALLSTNSGFGLSCGGHTLASYRRLPHGWRETPKGLHTDLYMWRQFIEQPWCHALSLPFPTVLKFASPGRMDWTLEQRLAEMEAWSTRIADPLFGEWLAAQALRVSWRQGVEARRATPWLTVPTGRQFAHYSLGTKLEFVQRGNATAYLAEGWSQPEAWEGGPTAQARILHWKSRGAPA